MTTTIEQIKELIQQFGSPNGLDRESARLSLVKTGSMAIDPLLELLDHPKHIFRWEAMKTLKEIKDERLIPVFIKLMEHEESDIRWLAYEGLSHQGILALKPVLEALYRNTESVFILAGAHHVFSALKKQHVLPESFPYEEMMPRLLQTGATERVKTIALQAMNKV